ncbi:hypothetical protein MHK_002785, partial [Candidatus Magnetomorum sp. HK-1]
QDNLEGITQKGYKLIDSGQIENGIKLVKKAAEKSYTKAQLYLGKHYSIGDSLPIDFKKSVMWLTKASKQGNSEAKFRLAFMYAEGKGIPINELEAIRLVKEAAKNGYKDAKESLRIYESEITLKVQTVLRAKGYYHGKIDGKWGKKSARALITFLNEKHINSNGDIDKVALDSLGIQHSILGNSKLEEIAQKGYKLINKGEVEAGIILVKKAAEKNYCEAQMYLGLQYSLGKSVPIDLEKSIMWLTKASNQGNSEAQLFLAQMYASGEGVNVNVDEALKLLEESANSGNKKAKKILSGYKKKYATKSKKDDLPTYEEIESRLNKSNNKILHNESIAKVIFYKHDTGEMAILYKKSSNNYDYNMILLKEGKHISHFVDLGNVIATEEEYIAKKVNQFISIKSSSKNVIDLRYDTPTKIEGREIMSCNYS